MNLALLDRFSLKQQALFARRLSFLVKGDVPLLECLRLMRAQAGTKGEQRTYDALAADVESGQYLATALEKFGRHFNELTVHLIRVGEQSGILSQNLAYLADELQKRQELRRAVVGALVYPLFITGATVGLVGLLTAYIFPKLMPVFAGLHADLPWSTRALIAVSGYLQAWGLLTLLACVMLGGLLAYARSRNEEVRLHADRLLLRIPFVGRVARAYNLATICRTLGLLLHSGVSVPAAMDIAARATPNRAYALGYRQAAAALPSGETLARVLGRSPQLFPELLLHMAAIGETTGNLAGSLLYMAQLYESEVDELTKNLSSAMEPALMLAMGGLVGFVAVSVITPLYGITQHLTPR